MLRADDLGVDSFLLRLSEIVGRDHVLTDPDLRAGYEIDWTGRFRGECRAVVRPASTAEVAAVVGLCADLRVPLVPQGGNTSLVGGAVPEAGAIVLSLRRLADVGPVDASAGALTAGAGATLAAVHDRAAEAGFAFGVDFASRASATVGGAIATDAGGIRVVRHGSMGRQVLGIEAVLADGRVVRRMPGQTKDAAGYDLPRLLAGSEGTLAVITAARLRLVTRPSHRVAAWIAVESMAAAVDLGARLRQSLDTIEALEFLDDAAVALAAGAHGPRPIARPSAATVLVEVAANHDPSPELEDVLAAAPEVAEAVVTADASGLRRLWALREAVTESIAREGIPHKLDVAVPADRLALFDARARAIVAGLDERARLVVFGHLAEGNLHVNVLGPDPDDAAIDDAILELVLDLGGSISPEHGIGRAKRRWLPRARDAADMDAMRAIKRALDPDGILNRGAVFEP